MGATSVTGVGQGSSEPYNKGAQGRQTLGVGHLIGPHVVYAGSQGLTAGAATVEIPPLTGVAADYVVIASSQDASSPAGASGTLALSSGIWTVTLGGNGTDVVSFIVVSVGS
jgi:hypothetical protein